MTWAVSTLGDVCQFIRNGKSIQQSKEINGLPITRIETIADQSIDDSRVGYAGISASEAEGYLLEAGDILFSHINSLEHLGKVAIYEGYPEKLVHGMNLLNLRPDGSKIDSRYLLHALRTPETKAKLLRIANKSVNQASIAAGNLKKVEIPVPSLAEQCRIAAILDKADALRVKRREVAAKLDHLRHSIFIDLFGDPVSNLLGWPTFSLAELGSIHTGKTPPTAIEGMFGGDIPFVTPGDLVGDISLAERKITEAGAAYTKVVRAGAALVGCIGNIGKTVKATVRCSFNQQINAVEWNGDAIDDEFGAAALAFQKPQMLAFSSATTVPILNKSSFSKISIPVPPLALQKRFSERIASVVKSASTCHAQQARMNLLFLSLQVRAFVGEVGDAR